MTEKFTQTKNGTCRVLKNETHSQKISLLYANPAVLQSIHILLGATLPGT